MPYSPRNNNFKLVIVLACVTTVGACGHEPVRKVGTKDQATAVESAGNRPRTSNGKRQLTAGERAAVVALKQVGIPYVYGGSTRNGFDCSGLVQYAYANVGKQLPRTTTAQWNTFPGVSVTDMRIGDLLFFRIDGKVSHVGMYVGDRRFVHAPSTGRRVSVESLDSGFYRPRLERVARPY